MIKSKIKIRTVHSYLNPNPNPNPNLILLLASLALPSLAADLEVRVQDFAGGLSAARTVILTPTQSPRATTNRLVLRDPKTNLTDSAGLALFTNVLAGGYQLTISGAPTALFSLAVPDTNATLNAADCLTTNLAALAGNAYSTTAADLRFLAAPAGTNLICWTNAGRVYVAGPSFGGGGSVAQGTNIITTTNGDVVTVHAVLSRAEVTNTVAAFTTNGAFYGVTFTSSADSNYFSTSPYIGDLVGTGERVVYAEADGRLNYSGSLAGFANPSSVTNSIWVLAGAMAPGGGTTADGGRNGASVGSYTNGSAVVDLWACDDTTNECVVFNWQAGYGFAGGLVTTLYWTTTNSLNGASNVVWDVGVSLVDSNGLFTANTWQTNGTYRFWSSNSVQVSKLPQITTSAAGVDSLLMFRISRLGTNAADAAVGDACLLGARIAFTQTNWVGGYP